MPRASLGSCSRPSVWWPSARRRRLGRPRPKATTDHARKGRHRDETWAELGSSYVSTDLGRVVRIRIGYELVFECPQPTPMILVLNVHYSRASDMLRPDYVVTDPSTPLAQYRDGFGNWCTRVVAPRGRT